MAKKVILASGSPRRKELLEQVGVEFEQRVSGKEERYTATEPKEIVKELALMKAENVASDIEAEKGLLIDTVVIGADTIVVLDGQILGKPRKNMHLKCFRISREEAMKFIQVWHFFLIIKKEKKR